jgi:hypothetical protein
VERAMPVVVVALLIIIFFKSPRRMGLRTVRPGQPEAYYRLFLKIAKQCVETIGGQVACPIRE